MGWTSRERVVAALEHREPDRVPVDLNPSYDSYLDLKLHLGLEIEEQIKPNLAMEVIPHPAVSGALGVDLISVKLGSPRGRRSSTCANGLVKDEWGVLYRPVKQPGGGSYMEAVHHPLAEATIDDLERYPWPDPFASGRGEEAANSARRLHEDTGLALVGRFGGPIIETAMYLVGWQAWLERLATEPDFAGLLLDRITDIHMGLDRVGLETTGRYLNILKLSGEDLGTQDGPLYSPTMFRSLLLPRLRRRWQAARSYLSEVNPSVKLMLHSCGSIRPYIPDLIAAGIQVLDPVQPRAAHMDAPELKREFGLQLTFHGGVDIQQVLPFGTRQAVEEEVRRCVRDYAPGGGYILAPSHAVQADTPPANVVAMCQAAHRYGQYPLPAAD